MPTKAQLLLENKELKGVISEKSGYIKVLNKKLNACYEGRKAAEIAVLPSKQKIESLENFIKVQDEKVELFADQSWIERAFQNKEVILGLLK